jgi:hypothetical protein
MMHQKMQKFQRRLFYAPVCSEDNALIENSKDSVTNNESNTSINNESNTSFPPFDEPMVMSKLKQSCLLSDEEAPLCAA